MKHLDAPALRALIARDPETVAWFREHLASPCDACEDFLAQHPDTDVLDGHVDALLLGLAPRREAAPDEVGWMRLRRRLRPPRHLGRWAGIAAALAACVLAVVLIPRLDRAPPEAAEWNGVKGSSRIALELAVAAKGQDGRLRRLDPGAAVTREDVLLLRYHATEAGSALLFQQASDGPLKLLGSFSLEAGTHDLGAPDIIGVSLSDDTGPVTLWLVASAMGEELSSDEVQKLLVGGRAREDNPLSVSTFDVFVQNSHNPR